MAYRPISRGDSKEILKSDICKDRYPENLERGLRASNLTRIRFGEISMVLQAMEIRIPKSKTDQEGRGHTVRLARGQVPASCPVRALQDWLAAAGIAEGWVFRRVNPGGKLGSENALSEKTVTRTIKGL